MKPLRLCSWTALALAVACGDPGAGGERGSLGDRQGPDGSASPTGPEGSDGLVGPDGVPTPGASVGPNGSSSAPDDVLGPVDSMGNPVPESPGQPVDVPALPEDAEPVTNTDVFSGSRVRRLTNVEYANTIADLFAVTVDIESLPLDTRQNDFTRNVAQAVDPVLGGHLQRLAAEVASTVVSSNLAGLVPCAGNGDRACAQTFLEGFAGRIYRRPLESSEVDSLLTLYDAGAADQSNAFASGMELVLQAMLQSASFLYVSEIGEAGAGPGDLAVLDPFELAASLSFLLTAHPPDDTLVAKATDGSILESSVREEEARRLLSTREAGLQIQRFVKQWLKLDTVSKIDKADERFAALRGPVEDEADRFISAIAFEGDGRLSTMLTAGYTFASPELASFYEVSADGSGRVDLTGSSRIGLLQTASFLAANSPNEESGPVLRGVAVLRKVLCVDLPSPAEVDDPEVQNVMPPPRDESQTTRARFAAHSDNPKCSSCHSVIDSIGFTFENFDAIGGERDTDNGTAVDTSGALNLGLASDGEVANSVELVHKIAAEPRTAECFARQVYRNGMADDAKEAEATFIRAISAAGTVTDDVKALLVQLVASNSFLLRRTPTPDEQL